MIFGFSVTYLPYESPILGQLLDLISPARVNIFEPRLKSYDPWGMVALIIKKGVFSNIFF